MTILTTGVLVVILMVIGVGTAITGVQLERNGLQHAADSAALAASQAVDPSRIYDAGSGPAIHTGSAREAAEEHLRSYPLDTARTEDMHVQKVTVDADGTAHVVLAARTNPPLVGWFTRGTGTSIPPDGDRRGAGAMTYTAFVRSRGGEVRVAGRGSRCDSVSVGARAAP